MADWVTLGRYTSFRLAEYGQMTKLAIDYQDLPTGRRIMKALCRHDFEFFDTDGRVIPNTHLFPDAVFRVCITWRVQKNCHTLSARSSGSPTVLTRLTLEAHEPMGA